MQPTAVTIVIPVYKRDLDKGERISLEQCCRVLSRHTISLIYPEQLCIEEYEKIFKKYDTAYSLISFDKRYFKSIIGYNELLLSAFFYQTFIHYDYILIYQLDAFVFRDELLDWCNKGYDYIGSPWFKRVWRFKHSKKLYAVGNGGFSLRNVHSCLQVLEHSGHFKPLKYFFTFHNSVWLKLKKMPLKRWKNLKMKNSVHFFIYINQKTEDRFWGLDTQNSYMDFRVAPLKESIKFAFECNPSYLYEINNRELPFGCHAWNRYEPDFWKREISKQEI
jgi:hypothetical protein